jgi:glucose/arabinose dehydrogenase
MSRGRRFILPVLAAAFLALLATACGRDETTSGGGTPTPAPIVYNFGLNSELVVGDGEADNVSAIAFAPDGRIFYAVQFSGEDPNYFGLVRVIGADGKLQEEPFASISVANYLGLDWGLTGLALDPNFEQNHYVYTFHTAVAGTNIGRPTILRFTDSNGIGTEQTVITNDFPDTFPNTQGYNANGEIHFGPDGYLYASVGDYDQGTRKPEDGGHPDVVPGHGTPIGKLLRMNKEDGSAAPGNPFAADAQADPRIFATGFREPFPFMFDAQGNIFGTDNTPYSCEELNLIQAGADYGWPSTMVFPFDDCAAGSGMQPIQNFAREGQQPGGFLSFVESQGMAFLADSAYEQLPDSLLVCQSEKSVIQNFVSGGAIREFTMKGTSVASTSIVVNDCFGDVAVRGGEVYYATRTEIRKLIEGSEAPATTRGTQAPPPLSS